MDYYWTGKKPTEPGWYWQSKWAGTSKGIVPVRYYVDVLCIGNYPLPDNCQWSGPISQPKDRPFEKKKIKRIRIVPIADTIRITPDGDEVFAQCVDEDCGWRGPISECDTGTEQDGYEDPPHHVPICPNCSEPVDY